MSYYLQLFYLGLGSICIGKIWQKSTVAFTVFTDEVVLRKNKHLKKY